MHSSLLSSLEMTRCALSQLDWMASVLCQAGYIGCAAVTCSPKNLGGSKWLRSTSCLSSLQWYHTGRQSSLEGLIPPGHETRDPEGTHGTLLCTAHLLESSTWPTYSRRGPEFHSYLRPGGMRVDTSASLFLLSLLLLYICSSQRIPFTLAFTDFFFLPGPQNNF